MGFVCLRPFSPRNQAKLFGLIMYLAVCTAL
jgi:hypothetical protein